MIVILNRDVKGTGKAGDIVKVSDGYARNMLIPKGYAKEATEGNVRNLEKQKAIAAEKKAEEKKGFDFERDGLPDISFSPSCRSAHFCPFYQAKLLYKQPLKTSRVIFLIILE